jgi:predicted nucleic acid-binding protein
LLVVSDTSPVRALHLLGLLPLLQAIYGEVVLPEAVAGELRHPRGQFPRIEPIEIPFVQIRNVTEPRPLPDSLQRGEVEAISLALELGAVALLIDEMEGRAVAKSLGIPVVGVLGILLQAKSQHLLAEIRPLVDRLRTEGRFFLAQPLVDHVLRLADE